MWLVLALKQHHVYLQRQKFTCSFQFQDQFQNSVDDEEHVDASQRYPRFRHEIVWQRWGDVKRLKTNDNMPWYDNVSLNELEEAWWKRRCPWECRLRRWREKTRSADTLWRWGAAWTPLQRLRRTRWPSHITVRYPMLKSAIKIFTIFYNNSLTFPYLGLFFQCYLKRNIRKIGAIILAYQTGARFRQIGNVRLIVRHNRVVLCQYDDDWNSNDAHGDLSRGGIQLLSRLCLVY